MSDITDAEFVEVTDREGQEPTGELRITRAEPGSAIEGNFDAVAAWVSEMVGGYTAGPIGDEEQYRDVKRDRTAVRKVKATVDAERKRIKAEYLRPLDDFERRCKEITAPCDEADRAAKQVIDAYEAAWRDRRRDALDRHYREFAPALVPNVPYTTLERKSWLNRTTGMEAATAELEAEVERIAQADAQLTGMHLAHDRDAHVKLFETLDLQAAVARDAELSERERAAAELEESKAAMRRQGPPEQAAEPEEAPEPPEVAETPAGAGTHTDAPVPGPRATYRFEFRDMTDAQLHGLMAYCMANDIHGRRMAVGEGR